MDKLKIGVVGLGKLGLPLAAVFANSQFSVTGIDANSSHVNKLKMKQFESTEPELNHYLQKNESQLNFSTNFNDLKNIDVVYLIVPTPSNDSGYFINDYLLDAIKEIGKVWQKASHVRTLVIVSTVMPGVTTNYLIPALESATGEKIGSNLQVVYSPEFIAIGSVIKDLHEPDLLLIGTNNEESAKEHNFIMNTIIKSEVVTRFLNFEEAELVKLLINNFITTKITFANQISEFTDLVPGTSASKIAEAIGNDTRIGKKYLKPGLGFGGPCFPRDTRALVAFAVANNWNSELALAVEKINLRQPKLMLNRIFDDNKGIKKVGVYGLAYKSGASILEESQAVELINDIANMDMEVFAYDPLIKIKPDSLNVKINFVSDITDLQSVDLLICTQSIVFADEPQLQGIKKYFTF
jgi:UDPglucose 6-dehydrogenase